jgi:hypothetical protein
LAEASYQDQPFAEAKYAARRGNKTSALGRRFSPQTAELMSGIIPVLPEPRPAG